MADIASAATPDQTRRRQLFRRQLPAVLLVDEGSGRDRRKASARVGSRRCPVGPVSSYSVLPEAVPFLLLPCLHREERQRGPGVSGRAGARVGAVSRTGSDRGSPARLRLLRGRHPVVPLGQSAGRPGEEAEGHELVEPCGRDHVRVRAGHVDREQADRHPQDGRDTAQLGGRNTSTTIFSKSTAGPIARRRSSARTRVRSR